MSCTLNSSLIGVDKAYRTTQTSMNYKTDILKVKQIQFDNTIGKIR